jgi:hypothetical protein
MSFNFGGLLGGLGQGAAAGSTFGPWGTAIGAIGGGLTGLFGGGGSQAIPTYQPTDLQNDLINYGEKQVRASKATKRRVLSEAEMYGRAGNLGSAEALLQQYINRYSNTKRFEKELKKSYAKEPDFSANNYWSAADELYKQQGLAFTPEDFGSFVDRAKSLNVRSPQAFGDMLKQQMVARGQVMTPQQEQLSLMFGDPYRDSTGRYTNAYRQPDFESLLSKYGAPSIKPVGLN